MSADDAAARFRRADALLDAALDRPTAERAAFVAAASAGDAALRDDVLALLRAHDRADSFLDAPAAAYAAPLLDAAARAALQAALGDAYRVEGVAGRGGMATVWRARDLRHQRAVAVKWMDAAPGAAAERFLAEVRVTAGMRHPHLLPLFDSGAADGRPYYVMPFVEGETLRARLDRERRLPVAEAVRLAAAVAGALDYAHGRGVVHRDLKPENVLLDGGEPLVADFGVALALAQSGGARVTRHGVAVGTPAYMSPEQAVADPALDARSDVYALGAVLYEMLAGEPPHGHGAPEALLARVLHATPAPVEAVRPDVPPAVAAVVARALARRPAERFPSARALADALRAAESGRAPAQPASPAPPARRRRAAAVGAGVAGALAVAALAWTAARRDAPPPRAVRFDIPALGALPFGSEPRLADDGGALVYVALTPEGRRAVFVRPLDSLRARQVPGTEGAVNVQPSPDGRWLAFNTLDDELRRVPAAGGTPQALGRGFRYARVAWRDDALLTEAYGRPGDGLLLIPAGGGAPRAFTRLARGESRHLAPVAAPAAGLVAFVVTSARSGPGAQAGTLAVAPLAPDATPAAHAALGVEARFPVAVVDGWLVYAPPRGVALRAVRLDARRRAAVGEPVTVLDERGEGLQAAQLSRDGTLLYVQTQAGTMPVLVDAAGAARPLLDAPGANLMNPRLSPDGRRLAIQSATPQGNDAHVWDLPTRTLTRLTTSGNAIHPTWMPDGRRVIYAAADGGTQALWWRDASGSTPPERLAQASGAFAPAVAADGRTLYFQRLIEGRWSLWRLPLDAPAGARAPQRVAAEAFDETCPAPSPDGRWLAYVANPRERPEPDVFVRPAAGGAAVQVSQAGGTEPVWSADGRRLYYRGAGRVVAATLAFDGAPTVTARAPLLDDAFEGEMPHTNYDVGRDGRLVMIAGSTGEDARAVVVVGWAAELRARLRAAAR